MWRWRRRLFQTAHFGFTHHFICSSLLLLVTVASTFPFVLSVLKRGFQVFHILMFFYVIFRVWTLHLPLYCSIKTKVTENTKSKLISSLNFCFEFESGGHQP